MIFETSAWRNIHNWCGYQCPSTVKPVACLFAAGFMATLLHSKFRRFSCWWRDSHNSPNNSKPFQEILTDMHAIVKAMIMLVEEDGDSFARRAAMYEYNKKRRELMKLVEEFYRAYSALTGRYNWVTGELHPANLAMTQAFREQVISVKWSASSKDKSSNGKNRNGLKQLKDMFLSAGDKAVDSFPGSTADAELKTLQKGVDRLCNLERYASKVQNYSRSPSEAKTESQVLQVLRETMKSLEAERDTCYLPHRLSLDRPTVIESLLNEAPEDSLKLTDHVSEDELEPKGLQDRGNKVLLKRIEVMEELLNKITNSENSFSGENTGFQRRKEKSTPTSAPLSMLQLITETMQSLLGKNTSLQTSLSAANSELEGLRAKSKGLEEFCQQLTNDRSNLLSEKSSLVSRIEMIEQRLEKQLMIFTNLEDKYSDLEMEKQSTIQRLQKKQDDLEGMRRALKEEIVEQSEHSCRENELAHLRKPNENLKSEVCELCNNINELHERNNEFQLWEAETASFCFDLPLPSAQEVLCRITKRSVDIEKTEQKVSSLENEVEPRKSPPSIFLPLVTTTKNQMNHGFSESCSTCSHNLFEHQKLQSRIKGVEDILNKEKKTPIIREHGNAYIQLEASLKEIQESKSNHNAKLENYWVGARDYMCDNSDLLMFQELKDIPLDQASDLSLYTAGKVCDLEKSLDHLMEMNAELSSSITSDARSVRGEELARKKAENIGKLEIKMQKEQRDLFRQKNEKQRKSTDSVSRNSKLSYSGKQNSKRLEKSHLWPFYTRRTK